MGDRRMKSYRLDVALMADVQEYSDRIGITVTSLIEVALTDLLEADRRDRMKKPSMPPPDHPRSTRGNRVDAR